MISNTWKRISLIGVFGDPTLRVNVQIILLNRLAFLIFFTNLLTLSINLSINSSIKGGGIFAFSIAALIWFSHYKRNYNFPKHLVGFVFPLVISFIMINTESNFAFINVFLVNVVLTFIIYEASLRLKLFSIISTSIIGLITLLFIVNFKPTYHIDFNPYNDFVIFISALAALALLISFYQTIIKEASVKQIMLLNALENKNIELERFAYVTSHDLKEPVRNIESLSKFIKGTINDKFSISRNKEMIGMIKESSIRMSSLIDSILSYSKLDTENLPFEEIELDEVLKDFKKSHVKILKDMNASLECEKLPTIVANKTFITLLFQNLIENGFKYNKSQHPVVKVSSHKSDAGIIFTIKDNGIGINKEFRSRIFEPFKRLHNSQSFKGSGLGLSICKKIVDMHGGEIWVEDNPSGGSSFQFNLPCNTQQVSP